MQRINDRAQAASTPVHTHLSAGSDRLDLIWDRQGEVSHTMGHLPAMQGRVAGQGDVSMIARVCWPQFGTCCQMRESKLEDGALLRQFCPAAAVQPALPASHRSRWP